MGPYLGDDSNKWNASGKFGWTAPNSITMYCNNINNDDDDDDDNDDNDDNNAPGGRWTKGNKI